MIDLERLLPRILALPDRDLVTIDVLCSLGSHVESTTPPLSPDAAYGEGRYALAAEGFRAALGKQHEVSTHSTTARYKYAASRAANFYAAGDIPAALEYYLAALATAAGGHDTALALTQYLRAASGIPFDPKAPPQSPRELLAAVDLEGTSPTLPLAWAVTRLLAIGRRHLAGALTPSQLKIVCEKIDLRAFIEKGDLAHDIERKISDDYARRLAEVAVAARDLAVDASSDFASRRPAAEALIRAIRAYARTYTFPGSQRETTELVTDALRILSSLEPATDRFVALRDAVESALGSLAATPSHLGTCFLTPAFWRLKLLAQELLRDFVAMLELGTCRKRFPLHKTGSTHHVVVPLWNIGKGDATDIEIICTAPARMASTVSADVVTYPESLSGSRQVVRDLMLAVKASAPHEEIPLDFLTLWRNPDGTAGEATFQLTLQGQQWARDQDWVRLRQENPYPLSWIDDPARLRGRQATIERLLRAIRNKELLRIYGEKRVGKTSVVRVFERLLRDKGAYPTTLPVYIEWGRAKRRHPGEVGETLCSATVEAYRKKFGHDPHLAVPALSQFGEQLGPAADFLETFADRESLQRIVVMLDDCEYIHSLSFFHGEHGQQFFQSLKTLANTRHVVLFLIGSEQFRTIFDRDMSSVVNIGDVLEITYITDPIAQRELIASPCDGILAFDDEAYNDIIALTAGNPWFSNKLCNELYDEMVSREDGYVTRTELGEIVGRISHERGLRGSFAHLWEESIRSTDDPRRASIVGAAILISVGRHHSSPLVAVEESAIVRATHHYVNSDQEVIRTLVALRQASVLFATDAENTTTYRIRVGLFHQWLRGVGRAELEAEFQELLALSGAESALRVSDTEITEVADRGWRRTDGRPVSSVEIRAWLDNFDSLRKQRYAYSLLRALQYFDRLKIRSALVTLLDKVKLDLVNVRFDQRGTPLNIFATYGDEGGKSGGVVLRALNQALGGLVRSGGIAKLEGFLRETSPPGEPRAVVLVNDLVGTGESAKKEILRTLSFAERAAATPELLRVYYVAVTGFQSVIESLNAQLASRGKLFVDEPLLDSDRPFSDASNIFTPLEKIECKRLCEDIGRQLVGDANKLGYGGCQALIVFEHGIPNNTLPIFWSTGVYEGREWVPLFKRETAGGGTR